MSEKFDLRLTLASRLASRSSDGKSLDFRSFWDVIISVVEEFDVSQSDYELLVDCIDSEFAQWVGSPFGDSGGTEALNSYTDDLLKESTRDLLKKVFDRCCFTDPC